MKTRTISGLLALAAIAALPVVAAATSGEDLFKLHCAACHADGGNIINPMKTLKKSDREANGVKTAKDIIGKMRKPGQGMTTFDTKTIPGKDARAIANYILKTFK
jgi:cytochrome c6